MRDPDATFSDPRQAVLYDVFNNDRSDLEAYVAIADEIEAHRVVDVGCGTGSLAVRLAELGFSVTGYALVSDGLPEHRHDDGAGDWLVAGEGERVAGVVVEEAQNLCVGRGCAVGSGEPIVGEIDLPHFVGLLGGETDVGRFGFLHRCRGDQSGLLQVCARRWPLKRSAGTARLDARRWSARRHPSPVRLAAGAASRSVRRWRSGSPSAGYAVA